MAPAVDQDFRKGTRGGPRHPETQRQARWRYEGIPGATHTVERSRAAARSISSSRATARSRAPPCVPSCSRRRPRDVRSAARRSRIDVRHVCHDNVLASHAQKRLASCPVRASDAGSSSCPATSRRRASVRRTVEPADNCIVDSTRDRVNALKYGARALRGTALAKRPLRVRKQATATRNRRRP